MALLSLGISSFKNKLSSSERVQDSWFLVPTLSESTKEKDYKQKAIMSKYHCNALNRTAADYI